MSPSLLGELNFSKCNILEVMAPQVAYKGKTEIWEKNSFCRVEPKCASPLQTGGGAVVCSLEFPGLFATAKGNVYYSCNLLCAVDFNCFSKCEDNCDIWKRLAICTNNSVVQLI